MALEARLLDGPTVDLEGGGRGWDDDLPRTLSEENRRLEAAIAASLRSSFSATVRLLLPRQDSDGDERLARQPSLARQFSVEPEFLCRICYCNDQEDLAICLPCGHRWHKDCLMGLIKNKVADAQLKILCPNIDEDASEQQLLTNAADVGCTELISREVIWRLADDLGDTDVKDAYIRFEALNNNPNVRECPECGHRQEGSAQDPRMTCQKCHSEYCYHHANAHVGSSCRDYERTQRKQNAEAEKWVRGHTLRCPWCQKPTSKQGGCNHMTCQRCHKHWCWVCNRKCADYSRHFADDNPFGCPGMQFADTFSLCHRFMLYNLRVAVVLLGLPLGLALLAFGLPVAIATMVLLMPFALCCMAARCLADEDCCPDCDSICEDFVWKLVCLGLWPLALVMAVVGAATCLATLIICSPLTLLISKCGCLDEDNYQDLLFGSAIWPAALLFVCLAIGVAVVCAPLTFPIALFYHCKKRPPLNQDDHFLGD